jgi:acetate kinase
VVRLTVPSIVCVNAGSATLKCARYTVDGGVVSEVDHTEVEAGPDALDAALTSVAPDVPPAVVAHRVVHGGPEIDQHCRIDEHVLDQLERARPFAPLHLPAELAALTATARRFPDAVQVACFDTTFHRTLPAVARRLPLPAELDRAGVRRFGFHGLSCEYVVGVVGADALGRAVIAHLGGGASLTAVLEGRSVDTTMGLTPTGGVVMATRTGDLDPGVVLHLWREHDLDADALEALVNERSGLRGLSGTTGDMRELLAARAAGDDAATLAIDVFCTSVCKHVGALVAVLGGVGSLVFTGGVGEHAPAIRAEVCDRLAHLGVALDAERNARADPVISRGGAAVAVRVVPTDENLVMARHAARLGGLATDAAATDG